MKTLHRLFTIAALVATAASSAQTIYTGTQVATGSINVPVVSFLDSSSAGTANITSSNFHAIEFKQTATAGSATLTITDTSFGDFYGSSTAGTASINIANFSLVSFRDTSSAASASIINDASVQFLQNSTAGSATFTNTRNLFFYQNSTGGTATVLNSGTFDLSRLTTPGFSIGSLAGTGAFKFGSAAVTVGTTNASTVISGVIADGGEIGGSGASLIKSGTGTLTLSGANTYTGGTTVANGTLLFATAASLPSTGPLTVATGATGAFAVGGTGEFTLTNVLARTGGFQAGAKLGLDTTHTTGGTLTHSASLTDTANGALGLTKLGPGTLILAGANTYTGGTTISAGTLQLGNGGAGASITGPIVNNGALVWNHSNNINYASSISGTGTLTKTGSGTLTLATANTFTGNTSVNAGNLALAHTLALQASTLDLAGGTLDFGNLTSATLGGLSGSSALALTNASSAPVTLTVGANAASTTYSGLLSGPGALTKTGAGTLTLSGANTYSGGMTVNAGTLTLTNLASFGLNGVGGISGPLSVASGATLDTSAINAITGNTASLYVSSLTGSGSIAMGNGFLVVNQSGDTTWSGVISGPGRLRKLGSGTLTLTSVNTYAAATFFNEGTILFNQLGNFGPGGLLRFQGGTLKWSAGNTTDISTRGVWIESGNSTLDTNGNNVSFANAIGNALTGSLTKSGAGTLTLAANNTYTGTTTVSGGTLQLGNGGAAGTVLGDITNHATLAWNRSDAATLSQVISGTGSLTKSGTGTLTFTGANTYTGGTTISAGTLQVGAGGTTGALAGNITNNAALTFNRSDAVTFAGNIFGTGSLTKSGTGTLTLTGANTYSGGTTLGGGALIVRSGTIGSGTITLADSNTALWLDSTTAGSLANPIQVSAGSTPATLGSTGSANYVVFSGNLALSRPTTLYDSTALRTNFSGVISGNVGTLTIAGAPNSRLVLEGVNTFTGNVKVSDGAALQLSSFVSAQATKQILPLTAQVDLSDSGRLWLFGNTKIGALTGGASSSVATLVGQSQHNTLTVGYTNTDTTFAGTIYDGGTSLYVDPLGNPHYSPSSLFTLSKTGTGTLTLTGSNTHTGGTTIDRGTLQLGNGGTSGSVTGNIANYDHLIFNRSDNTTYGGVISGNGTLTKTGAGTLTLSGTNTFTGTTTLSAGQLALASAGALGTTGEINFAGGALQFSAANTTDYSSRFSLAAGQAYRLDTNGGNVALASALTSAGGSLTKVGTGTLTLTAANTYTGGTTLNGGTLFANNTTGSATGTGAVTVLTGATLGGTGSISGLTTIGSGGFLAPGNSPGTLTFTNGLTLTDGAALNFELGTTSDLLRITGGTLTGSASAGGITLNLVNSGGFAADTYVLLDFAGATTSGFDLSDFTFGSTIAGYTYALAFNGIALELTATASAVPEPATYAVALAAAALAMTIVRRRQAQSSANRNSA